MSYVDEVLAKVKAKDANEPEFLQTVEEVLETIRPLIDEKEEQYRKIALLERLCEPEKVTQFRVPWTDDQGQAHVQRAWRVQFNSAIGPYKGGIRFQPSVNLSMLKFLAFEQTFKNSLTGLPIGGGKGGSDFDPQGKSDAEIMRYCQSFMIGLYNLIGANMDCPAGDMGVGGTEIGYMYGQYKRLTGQYEAGALSGKPISCGGSLGRTEATGFGAVYYAQEMLRDLGKEVKGTTFCLSGFGNVCWGATKKIDELGGKVISISGPDGYIVDPDGITGEKIDYMLEMRASRRNKVKDYADKFGVQFFEGQKSWGRVGADVYMPCALQNEVRIEDAERMIAENSTNIYIEVSNMPTTNEAMKALKDAGWKIAPSKAVNAGGVAVSALEMSQNAEKLAWSFEEVDQKLHGIMKNIYANSVAAAKKYGMEGDLVAGANLAGAAKVLQAMVDQGIC